MSNYEKITSMQRCAHELNCANFNFIRIKAGDKKPTDSGWTTTPSKPTDIASLGDQIGVIGGPLSDGLVIIDPDISPPESLSAEEKKAYCEEKMAIAREILPHTDMIDSRASSEGAHFYYRLKNWKEIIWPESLLPGTSSKIRKTMEAGTIPKFFGKQHLHKVDGLGIDILGASGQAVVPPSMHKSGERREWENGKRGEPTTVEWDRLYSDVLALGRAWGLKVKDKRLEDYKVNIKTNGRLSCDLSETDRVKRAKLWLAKEKPAMAGNGGQSRTFHVCGVIAGGFDLSEEGTLLVLEEWNNRCNERWTEEELRKKVKEAKESYKNIGDKLAHPEKKKRLPQNVVVESDNKVYLAPEQHLVAEESYQYWLNVTDKWHVYQWMNRLMRVMAPSQTTHHYLYKPDDGHELVPLKKSIVSCMLSECCDFIQVKKTEEDYIETKVAPPLFYAENLLDRGKWSEVKALHAITDYPVMTHTGEVVNEAGVSNGILVRRSIPDLCLIERPTQSDAKSAYKNLLDVFEDFPLKSDVDKAVTITAILTLLVRPYIDGPTPMFIINANTRGSGKSLLAKVIHLIVSGIDLPLMSYTNDQEELRKKITTALMNGDTCLCFDNVKGTLGGETLDKLITAKVWQDRVLGANEQVKCPAKTVLLATSNNATITGDTSRRLLAINLESPEVNPEDRSDFKIANIERHVKKHRTRLVSDAFTVLRTYLQNKPEADKDNGKLIPLGSFEDWRDMIQGAVVWAGGKDPVLSNKAVQVHSDSDTEEISIILRGLMDMGAIEEALSSSQLLDSSMSCESWSEALSLIFEGRDIKTSRGLGRKLAYIKGRRISIDGHVVYLDTVVGSKNLKNFMVKQVK